MPEQAHESEQKAAQSGGVTQDTDVAQGMANAQQHAAQTDYLRSLQSQTPAQQARAALDANKLPIGPLIPDTATSFTQTPDGRFTLELPSEVRMKSGNVTLVLTPKIEGVMAAGQMTDIKGVYGEKKVMFFSGKGNVLSMKVNGDMLIVETDHSQAKEVEMKISDLVG